MLFHHGKLTGLPTVGHTLEEHFPASACPHSACTAAGVTGCCLSPGLCVDAAFGASSVKEVWKESFGHGEVSVGFVLSLLLIVPTLCERKNGKYVTVLKGT